MVRKFLMGAGIAGALGAAMLPSGGVQAQDQPFGGPDSVDYAAELWAALVDARLAGPDAMHSNFYVGEEPHGFVLETFDTSVEVAGRTGRVVVKNNYGPEGVTPAEAGNAPGDHLAAVTVMFRREAGYDPDNADWFWAKYLPDGSLDVNPAGAQLAGRVAKGAGVGCIACHSNAAGGDYLFITDRPD